MRNRLVVAPVLLTAIVLAASVSVAGQVAAPASSAWTPPHTAWGDPDLQGLWSNNTTTPFERPSAEPKRDARPRGPGLAAPEYWYERFGNRCDNCTSHTRTSMVVDPPDGLVPALTAEAQKRRVHGTLHLENFDTWEDLSVWDRCITRGVPGSMLPTLYNNNYQILQTPGYVVILYEMIHDARIIPLDGRPHLPSRIRQWMGDSRARWEGNTLVVEVTNFTDKTPVHTIQGIAARVNHSEDLRVVERFTRVKADTIDYQVTIEDPRTFTKSWTVSLPMTTEGSPERILEYACHEGNHAVANALSGSRALEKADARREPERR